MTDPVEQFRRQSTRRSNRRNKHKKKREGRPPVPTRERVLVGVQLLNVLWLAFALGGVRLWGELPAVGMALLSLMLLPKWKTGELPGSPTPAFQLLKLPLFWLGLALYSYFFIQTWNLAWTWTVHNGRPAIISLQPRFDWLPAGLQSPLEQSNPFRSMLYYGMPWLACCTAWAGLNTRRAVTWLLQGLTLIGIAFAGLALYQHFSGAERILGLFETVPSRVGKDFPFWGTLINCNHGAFFLILANGLCLGLFLSGWHRDLRMLRHGGGAWLLYLGLALLTSFAVLMAQARGAIIFLAVQWLLFLIICSLFFVWRFGWKGLLLPAAFLLIALAAAVSFIINPDIFENQKKEWALTASLTENPDVEARFTMMKIAAEMIEEKPWLGHGAGSWRYLHLPYLKEYPNFRPTRGEWVIDPVTGKREYRTITIWFQNAHVDLMEYVVEWGIIGCAIPTLMLLAFIVSGIRNHRGWDIGGIVFLATALVVFAGASIEFHFRIPLVILVWCLLLTLTFKSAQLNARTA